ncbi:MAG: hypothetical protein IKY29_01770 [Clostridia bacterium]|nr:hypothetical protein [Clostridia bacterium]
MSNKQKINDAFANIDEALIESVARAPRNKHTHLERLGAIAACAALLLSFALGAFFIAKVVNARDNGPVRSEWVIVSGDKTSVEKKTTGTGGKQYVLRIDYTSVADVWDVKPAEDVCGELLGQWMISNVMADYPGHYSVFAEEFLKEYVYVDFSAMELSVEEGMQRLAALSETAGLTRCDLEYSVLQIQKSEDAALQTYREEWREQFSAAGLEVDKIECVMEYVIGEIRFCLNDVFSIDVGELPEILFYQYEGEWYAAPQMMDIKHDYALHSDKEKQSGYYEVECTSGVVEEIYENYVRLQGSDRYYLMKEGIPSLSLGDTVEITHYVLFLECNRVSDHAVCHIYVARSITLME